jgi:hypothetical protein
MSASGADHVIAAEHHPEHASRFLARHLQLLPVGARVAGQLLAGAHACRLLHTQLLARQQARAAQADRHRVQRKVDATGAICLVHDALEDLAFHADLLPIADGQRLTLGRAGECVERAGHIVERFLDDALGTIRELRSQRLVNCRGWVVTGSDQCERSENREKTCCVFHRSIPFRAVVNCWTSTC